MTNTLEIATERFNAKLKLDKLTGCLVWQGCKSNDGYGGIVYQGKKIGTHRFAYILRHGSIPTGMYVCHTCDNPSCCNADHLFAGTAKENTQDALKKGRASQILRGELHNASKLTWDNVREIRRLWNGMGGIKQSELAIQFGVNQSLISKVIHHRSWIEENV